MKLAVIGCDRVGLVVGACFAAAGHDVFCVDGDPSRVEALKDGSFESPEAGLAELLRRSYERGKLTFTTSIGVGVIESEIVFLSGEQDLEALKGIAEDLAESFTGYRLISVLSVLPPRSRAILAQWIARDALYPFDIVSNPVFLREGSAIEDFSRPARVVIGTDKRECFTRLAQLYRPWVSTDEAIVQVDTTSPEPDEGSVERQAPEAVV